MKRKAVIVLNFEVEDCIEAKARESEIRRLVDSLRDTYGDVCLKVTERRPRLAKRAATPPSYRPAEPSHR